MSWAAHGLAVAIAGCVGTATTILSAPAQETPTVSSSPDARSLSDAPAPFSANRPDDLPDKTFGDTDAPQATGGALGKPLEGSGPSAKTAEKGEAEGGGKSSEAPGVSDAEKAFGAFQRGYYLTAMNLALPLAQKGNAAAQTLVAEIFARGLGVARSLDDAAFWYGEAAKGGDASAQFRYALLLLAGQVVPKDEERGAALMKKAADAGIAAAQFNHAQILVSSQPGDSGLKKALPYFEKAARAGIPDAQYALSQIYLNSDGVPDAKREKARYWLTQAAKAGYDTAQLDLAIWLVDGVGGDKDYDEGFQWMRRAAEGGNVMAQNRLARLYRNGIGHRQDSIAAATWYVLARRAGLQDRGLDDFYQGLDADTQKEAIARANRLQKN